MNQYLKDAVYCTGTQTQVDYMINVGGMTEEEAHVFQLLHEGKPDDVIQDRLGMSRKYYERVENQVRRKLLVAVFHCIDTAMVAEHF